jgi:transposase
MENIKQIIDIEFENNKLKSENLNLKNENAKLTSENENLKILNNWYLEQFRLAQHRRFCASSERSELPDQLNLFNEAEVYASSEITGSLDEDSEENITYRRKKTKGKREEFYNGIPTEQIVHELPENERICPICGGLLHACGHEVLRREVEVIPAQVRAVEHVQTVYGCRDCEKNSDVDSLPMVKASVPAPVISGSGIASPSLVAFIISNKYVLALPLNRQEQELKRMNIHISRQTMANWVIFVAMKWLAPIYFFFHEVILQGEISHGDETTLQVIIEEGRKASQKSYMWVYCTGKDADRQVVLFDYQQTRHGKHPLAFLEGYDGYLHVDGYAGYRKLEDQGVILVECWGHLRRKFDEALKALNKEAKETSPANIGLEYCNQLFDFERRYNEEELSSEERTARRELEAKPVAEAFFAWADSMLPQTSQKSKLRQAIVYATNQKPRLMNVFLDGRLEISNNRAERTIRLFAVGRNNWQFAYSEKGAEASAIAYSVVQTALANGLVPFLYLNFLLSTLPNIPREQYADCLPWNPTVQELCKPPPLNN